MLIKSIDNHSMPSIQVCNIYGADCLSQGILCTKHKQVNIFNVLACHSPAFARLPGSYLDPRDNPPASAESRPPPRATRSHVPRSQRLRRRRFAPITRTTDDPVSRSASLPLTASHPRVGAGNVSRPLLRCRSGNPATDPHSGTRDSLPSLWPLCGQRLRRGAFGASGSAASVSRPIYRVLCRVYIPLSNLPILLSVQRVACLPNRLASSRRG